MKSIIQVIPISMVLLCASTPLVSRALAQGGVLLWSNFYNGTGTELPARRT